MAEVLHDILNDIDKPDLDEKILNFKEHMKTLDILEIMFPPNLFPINYTPY